MTPRMETAVLLMYVLVVAAAIVTAANAMYGDAGQVCV